MGGTRSTQSNMSKMYKILVGKPEGKRALRRTWNRLEGNVKMYFRKLVWKDVCCTILTQNSNWWCALVNMVMNN